MKSFILTLCAILFVNFSCENTFQNHIIELKKQNSKIKEGKWQKEQYVKTKHEELFQLFMVENDTIYNLFFIIESQNNKYKIGEYRIRYSDALFNYNCLMDIDTLYSYKENKVTGTKTFYVGKCFYMLNEREGRQGLTNCQIKYLTNNMDSLQHIRGDFELSFPCCDND